MPGESLNNKTNGILKDSVKVDMLSRCTASAIRSQAGLISKTTSQVLIILQRCSIHHLNMKKVWHIVPMEMLHSSGGRICVREKIFVCSMDLVFLEERPLKVLLKSATFKVGDTANMRKMVLWSDKTLVMYKQNAMCGV